MSLTHYVVAFLFLFLFFSMQNALSADGRFVLYFHKVLALQANGDIDSDEVHIYACHHTYQSLLDTSMTVYYHIYPLQDVQAYYSHSKIILNPEGLTRDYWYVSDHLPPSLIYQGVQRVMANIKNEGRSYDGALLLQGASGAKLCAIASRNFVCPKGFIS